MKVQKGTWDEGQGACEFWVMGPGHGKGLLIFFWQKKVGNTFCKVQLC